MAVKRLPAGVNVDMGFSEESPMDKLNNLLSTAGNIAAGVSNIKQQRENNNVQALSLINDLIKDATTSSDIQNIEKIYNNTVDENHVSSNPAYNASLGIANLNFENKKNRINEIETSSQEFANNLYSTNNVFNTSILNMDANQLEKTFTEMNKDEVAGWIKTAISEREKISIYGSNIKDIYGNKNPNFQINVNGQMRSIKQMGLDLKRYSETIDALTMKALDDGVLSQQEARGLMMISPSQGVGAAQFNQLVDKKRKLAGDKYKEGQNLIYNKSLSIVKKMLSAKDTPLSGIDAASLLSNIVEDEDIKGVAADAIPSMEEMKTQVDGNLITFRPINNSMSDDEKIQAFKDRLSVEGAVAPSSLNAYFSSIISNGETQIKEANRIWDAFGGREDYFGLDEVPISSDEFLQYEFSGKNTENLKFSTQDQDQNKKSAYYDSTLAVDTGALDNVDTSNVKSLNNSFIKQFPFNEKNKDSIPVRLNNPGNLKSAGQENSVEGDGGFAKFNTIQDGWKALYIQIELDADRGDTLETFIKGSKKGPASKDAYVEDIPPGEQEKYLKFMQQKLKTSKDVKLKDLDVNLVAEAIAMREGYTDSSGELGTGKAPTKSDLNVEEKIEDNIDTVMSDKELLQAREPVKISDYDKLNKSEVAKLEQSRKQFIKQNPRMQVGNSINTTEKFYNYLKRIDSKELPELKGLDKIISLFKIREDESFKGRPYAELSEENKKRISQALTQFRKKSRSRAASKLTNEQFYKSLSDKELKKILK